MQKGKKLFLSIAMSILGVAALACIALFCVYMLWERAPEIEPQAPSAEPLTNEPREKSEDRPDPGLPFDTQRQDGIYTVLLVGNDDGTGNTDTMVAGKIDTVQHKMDFVSIPRDTIINVDWSVRKLNSVYWGSKSSGGTGIDALGSHIKRITGFEADCYAVVDLGVFIDVVDAMGGVDFDVPVDMFYEDAKQNLYIDLKAGPQHLDGYQAMGLCRYRYGYANGDYGRIEMQQRFLKSCAEQFISLGNIPNVSKVVKILASGLDTNLSSANIAYFLRQALLCAPEDINFHTVPSDSAGIGGLSYSVIRLYDWLPMLNECLNPFDREITADNLDIVYCENGVYKATTALQGEWYFTAPPQPGEEEEEDEEGPTIIVVPTPSPQVSPEPDISPEPGTETPEASPEPGPETDTPDVSPEPEGGETIEGEQGVFA